jgi:iron complex transport system substrate-binding protein
LGMNSLIFLQRVELMIMKRKQSTYIAVLLILCLLLAGCSAASTSSASSISSQEEASSVTVTDSYGRTVTVPEHPEKLVPLGNAPRMLTYLGLSDKFVGVPQCEHSESPIMAYAWVHKEDWEELPNVGNDSLGAMEWFPEEILACDPDVILCTYDGATADKIQSQTGIPVVAVTSPAVFTEEYETSLSILGKACGAEERANTLITYIHDCLDDLEKRTADIPEEEKPLILGAAATFSGGHGIEGVYANNPIFSVIHGRDAAQGITEKAGGVMVDKEQILLWDPDILFLDASNMELIQTEYQEDPSYFQNLSAVKNGKVYQWPNATWHYANYEISLATAYYTGSLLYPDAFQDISFEEKADEIFQTFLGVTGYLETLEEAGAGYGTVTIGQQ